MAGQLVEEFGFAIGQRATSDRTKLYTVTRQDTYTALGAAVKGDAPALLWDRLFYSELIYAEIVGRPVEFKPSEQGFITSAIDAIMAPTILCLPPLETVIDNEEGTEQMSGVHENLKEIYRGYVSLLQEGVMPSNVIVYDYTGANEMQTLYPWGVHYSTYDEIVEEIRDYLEYRKEREWAPIEVTS